MYSIDTMTSLNLGEQGEHLANEIRVDMSPWVDEDNTLRFYIVALRHGETNPYIPATTMEDNILVWPVTSADTAITGAGLTQFVATDGTRIVKSKRIKTTVGDVIPGTDSDTPPDPASGWVERVINTVQSLTEDAQAAKADAESAAEHAESVTDGIDQAGAAQVEAVNAAGTTQVNAVQAKGTQVINSIPADYSALSSDVTGLKSALYHELLSANAFNAVPKIPDKAAEVINGITVSVSNGVITLNGTASDSFVFDIFASRTEVPAWYKPGTTYHLKQHRTGTNGNAYFRVVEFYSGNTQQVVLNTANDVDFTVPSNANLVGVVLRITVANTRAVNCTISPIMCSAKTNTELEEMIAEGSYVLYEAQSLTNSQKKQARTNIDAPSTTDAQDIFNAVKNQVEVLKWHQGNLSANVYDPTNVNVIFSDPIPVTNYDTLYYFTNLPANTVCRIAYCRKEELDSQTCIGTSDSLTGSGYTTISSTSQATSIRLRISVTDSRAITPDVGNSYGSVYIAKRTDILEPSGDTTDRTPEILARLKRFGVCEFASGDFYVNNIEMQTNTSLIGHGSDTRLILSGSSDGSAVTIGLNRNNCSIRDITFIGSLTEIELSDTVGGRHGISWIGNNQSAHGNKNIQPAYGSISNCYFSGFTGGAITCDDTGPAVEHGLTVENVQISNCNAGINIAYNSEFHRFTNVITYGCKYACVNNGGNNIFVNCGFSNNKIGMIVKMVDGSGRSTINNTHGSAIGCMFEHMDRDDITLGRGEAVHIEEGVNGFIFVGCHVAYGSIYAKNSREIVFRACRFANMKTSDGTQTTGVEITIEETNGNVNSDKLFFSDCIFTRQPIVTSIETNGKMKIVWDNCYMPSGAAVPSGTMTLAEIAEAAAQVNENTSNIEGIDLSDIKTYTTFVPGGVNTNETTVDLVNIDYGHLDGNPDKDFRYYHIIIGCNPGDRFIIEALGMGSGEYHNQYVFVDSNGTILSKSPNHNTGELIIPFDPSSYITAPANANRIIVNHRIFEKNDWYAPCVYKVSDNPITDYLATYEANCLPYAEPTDWKQKVIAAYDVYLAILDDDAIKMSNDCGNTWTSGVDISTILNGSDPVICNTHIYSNGTLAFFTKKHAYYLEYGANNYHEATCYDTSNTEIDPTTITAYMVFKSYNDYNERQFVTIGGTERDVYVFGNYKYGYGERALIWYSKDMGHTYKIAFDFGIYNNSDSNVTINGYPLNIRHVHGILYYEPDDAYICMTGDYTTVNSTSGLADSCVLKLVYDSDNDTWSATLLGTGVDYKWTSAAIWNGEIYYSNDNTPGKVFKCAYSDIGDLTKHTVVLDNMYNDPRHLIFGHNGDMIVTQCNNRNTSDPNYTAPIAKHRESRRIYYSPNRKDFFEVTLPLRHLRGNEEVAFIKPLTQDGHVIIGTYERKADSTQSWIDTNILPSVYLDEYLRAVGYKTAFGKRI